MGKFTVGQVVSSAFPFSDLTSQKFRPALVAAIADFDDLILCQITSRPYSASHAIKLTSVDFQDGDLPVMSYIRPDKLFTADDSMISRVYGEIKSDKLEQVHKALRTIFTTQ